MAKLYYDRNPETLDWSNDKGRTALHVAALKGNEELVEVCPLIRADAAWTPRAQPCRQMLCDLGGDPDLTDNDGNTPLH
jgi:ankyrin repeat protein